jgi:diguanylate cyclase (GGDEF)-like protein
VPRPQHNADLLVMLIDLDLFKQVNDTHGHAAGDLVLQQAGQLFQRSVRETDAAVRFGGEEFLLLYRDADRRDAPALAERILTLFRSQVFDLGNGQTLHKTCSIGVAAMPFIPAFPETGDGQHILKLADHALMMAKSAGRDRWIFLEAREPGAADGLGASPDALIAAGRIVVRSSDELLDARAAKG